MSKGYIYMFYQLIGLINILCWGLMPLIGKHAVGITKDPLNTTNIRYILGAIISIFLYFIYSKKTIFKYSYKVYGLILAVAILGFLARYCNYILLSKYKASIVSSIISPLLIITTLILGRLFFNETITMQQIMGIIIIAIGIFIVLYK